MTAHVRMAARIWGTLTRKCERHLAEDVDRDDDRRDMQARVAQARQDEWVAGAPEADRPARHAMASVRRMPGSCKHLWAMNGHASMPDLVERSGAGCRCAFSQSRDRPSVRPARIRRWIGTPRRRRTTCPGLLAQRSPRRRSERCRRSSSPGLPCWCGPSCTSTNSCWARRSRSSPRHRSCSRSRPGWCPSVSARNDRSSPGRR